MCFPISFRFLKKRVVGNAFPLLFGLCFILGAAVFFSGCKTDEDDDTGHLVGKWVSQYQEEWDITPTTVTTANFAGTIENNPDFEAPAGVIIIKYTTKPQYYDYDSNPPYTQTGGPFDPPGDYYAIYWKSLTTTSIELANAWSITDYSHNGAPETKTLEDAKTKFTLDAAQNYVGMYSACEKQ